MLWLARRQITKNGNSLTVALPRLALYKMGVIRGDWVEMTLDEDSGVLTIRACDRRPSSLPTPSRRIGMSQVQG